MFVWRERGRRCFDRRRRENTVLIGRTRDENEVKRIPGSGDVTGERELV